MFILTEECMYARLWEEDRQAKCKREEMEAALQLERNREMIEVVLLQLHISYTLPSRDS